MSYLEYRHIEFFTVNCAKIGVMFDDRISVESPGRLPGLVRINNIRNMHFSRNPKIAALLKEYKYVKEFGEGVDRMFREMNDSGLPDPEYHTMDFMTYAVVKNNFIKFSNLYNVVNNITNEINEVAPERDLEKDLQKDLQKNLEKLSNFDLNDNHRIIVIEMLKNKKITQKKLAILVGINERNIRININELKKKGIIQRIGPDKGGHWNVDI